MKLGSALTTRRTARDTRLFVVVAAIAVAPATVIAWSARAEPLPGTGTCAPVVAPDRSADLAVPGAPDNRFWYGDGSFTYTAPGGNAPTRAVQTGNGRADVSTGHAAGGVAAGLAADGSICSDVSVNDGYTPTPPAPPEVRTPDPDHPSLGLGLVPGGDDVPAPLAWHNPTQVQEVWFASRATGARLHGIAVAADPLPATPVPVVVIVPGSGPGVAKTMNWIARALAGNGYLTVIVEPQGVGYSETFDESRCGLADGTTDPAVPCPGVPWQQADNYLDAVLSGVDFATSRDYPWAERVEHQKGKHPKGTRVRDDRVVGVVGYSLSARAASYAQGIPEGAKIDAIVAFDNLASDLAGDTGSPSGGPPVGTIVGGELPGASRPVTPRVPALGEASETTQSGPDAKTTAMRVWRDAGVDSMEVVFDGTTHTDWSQGTGGSLLPKFAYYAQAWFDRYLLDDPAATDRLMTRDLLGEDVATVFADRFLSAVWMNGGGVSCDDLRAGC